MQLYLIRHAEKLPALHDDPALSMQGHRQAQKLKDYFQGRKLELPTQILCSPRLRTQQTVKPLAQNHRISMQTSQLLEEKSPLETTLEFEARVDKVLQSLSENQIHCICSHYDWVIVASQTLLKQKFIHHGDCHHWQPCQVVLFEKQDDSFVVKDFGVIN